MFEGNSQVKWSCFGSELGLGALERDKGMRMVLKTVVRTHDVDGIVVQFAPLSPKRRSWAMSDRSMPCQVAVGLHSIKENKKETVTLVQETQRCPLTATPVSPYPTEKSGWAI